MTVFQDTDGSQIRVAGSSITSVGYGIGMYFRDVCNASLTWVKTGGMAAAERCVSASHHVKVGQSRTYTRSVKFTYYQNVVDSSYSFAWWGWDRWSTEIDWMALHGINLALMYVFVVQLKPPIIQPPSTPNN